MNNLPSLFEGALSVIMLLGGAILKTLWQSNKDLQSENISIIKKIAEIEVLVAGDYVKRDYFESKVDALFSKVDSIHDKLDRKVDK